MTTPTALRKKIADANVNTPLLLRHALDARQCMKTTPRDGARCELSRNLSTRGQRATELGDGLGGPRRRRLPLLVSVPASIYGIRTISVAIHPIGETVMTCSAKELRKTIASSMFPRFVVGAALAGASMLAQAGPFFNCVSGTANDCTTAQSTLSWAWDGQDFTVFNSGAGYVSEVYFDLGSGMSAAFYGGTGVVNFMAGAHPASLPGGMGIGFSSDASFDSDAPGGSGYGIDNGESATFRILAATLGSVDIGDLAAGVHVRGLATGGASLVSTSATATAVPEPASIGLAAIGLGLLAWLTRRTRILPVTGR